jgi:3-hydroxy-3-methylglutaryl CoA synthase
MPLAAIAEAHAWAFPSTKTVGGEKAFCDWDEDVITMAVEAGRDCLRNVGRSSVTTLDLASTTAPYADLQNAVLVGAALRLDSNVCAVDTGGSTRAGLVALSRACALGNEGDRLIVAADKRIAKPGSAQELSYGAGAGGVLVGEGSNLLARFLGSHSVSLPFIDHFRQADQKFDYFWEERWIRDEGLSKIVPRALTALLQQLDIGADRIKHFGIAGGPPGGDRLVAKALSISQDTLLHDLLGQVGDTGTAQPLLLLIQALERATPGDVIVIGSFGQGCEVVAFEMQSTAAPEGRRGLARSIAKRIPETAYLKMLSFEGLIELDWGMRAEVDQKTALTQLYRAADQIFGFVGGHCRECAVVQFPRMPACVNCGAVGSQAPFCLADEPASVKTCTADWLQYHPSPPLYMGLVQFEIGARVLMEIVDVGVDGFDVDTPLEMRFRIKARDHRRHHDRYFWKAAPATR